ncbi:hypothetical protein DAEQUDRAFT_729926 [Daedalea quercina L-15889]|uniref:Uncharacterized protein n=1 Tax=Daedalea quercina L-15889 TaxID=1314783 RepID=A0A165NC26_9APHY|nr:hypothetical protein DAEQUDRAFT_729926 [Daedalea quercina L-15889]
MAASRGLMHAYALLVWTFVLLWRPERWRSDVALALLNYIRLPLRGRDRLFEFGLIRVHLFISNMELWITQYESR